jgi:DNA-directed RNA polymerase subunit RPC12/RpoP
MATIQIHCSNCQYKVFTEGANVEGLVEVKKADPPLRADGKTAGTFNRGRFFKCPKCGYTMKGFFPPKDNTPEEPKNAPNFPKDMDERINGNKLGDDFLKEIDKYMKHKQIAEQKAKKKGL